MIIEHFPLSHFEDIIVNEWYDMYTKYGDIIAFVLSGHTHVDDFTAWGTLNNGYFLFYF